MAYSSSSHLNNTNNINNNNNKNPRNSSPNFPTTTTTTTPSSLLQSTLCKSSISSLILSTFSNNTTTNSNSNSNSNNNKNGGSKKSSTLLGFGCTAQQEVSVPGFIRSSANWDDKKAKNDSEMKKKKKKKKKKNRQNLQGVMLMDESVVQDFWCGVDSGVSASVDCLQPLPFRHKLDLHTHISQHGTYSSRQRLNTEHYGGLELDASFDGSNAGPDVFEARYYHHLRNQSPERLAEILMFQNGLLSSRRSSGADRYRDLRLDVDSMTYEELLDLGERIGHVSTGLRDDQIGRCLRKAKLSVVEVEPKCSICQEEYNGEDEIGKLKCGHAYHLPCIKQWLARKNTCPVCKAEASSQ